MRSQELSAFMDTHNLKSTELAELMGVTERTIFRWLNEKSPIPTTAALLILSWTKLDQKNIPWRHDAILYASRFGTSEEEIEEN